MGTIDLPDIYAQSQVHSPRGAGIHMRQITSAHITANMYTSVQADSLDANMSVTTGFILYACLKDSILVRQQITL